MRHLFLVIALIFPLAACGSLRTAADAVSESREQIVEARADLKEALAAGKELMAFLSEVTKNFKPEDLPKLLGAIAEAHDQIEAAIPEVKAIVDNADKDGDGSLSFGEILAMVLGGGATLAEILRRLMKSILEKTKLEVQTVAEDLNGRIDHERAKRKSIESTELSKQMTELEKLRQALSK